MGEMVPPLINPDVTDCWIFLNEELCLTLVKDFELVENKKNKTSILHLIGKVSSQLMIALLIKIYSTHEKEHVRIWNCAN